MTTGVLKVERSGIDSTNSTTVGVRLKMYLDPLSIPGEDPAIFVYEVVSHGTGNISMFIGVSSPSDVDNLVLGEPVTPVVGDRFRVDTVDLLFRSDIHTVKVIALLTEDVKEYFRLKAAIGTIPGTPIEVVIT